MTSASPWAAISSVYSDPEFPFSRFTTTIQMLNCRYNDPLIAGDGFQLLHWHRPKKKWKNENSCKNINTNNGGVQAHRRACISVIKTWYNGLNDWAWRDKHSGKINTLALWTHSYCNFKMLLLFPLKRFKYNFSNNSK